MPCDSIQLCAVELGAVTDLDLLQAALIEEFGSSNVRRYGEEIRVVIRGQQVRIVNGRVVAQTGYEHLADEIRQAYARKAIRVVAKRFGWQAKETQPKRQYQLARRY